MFHFLSKLLQFLTIPFVVIVGIILSSSLIKNVRRKKILLRIGLGLLLFFSNDFIANEAMRAWEVAPVHYRDLKPHYKFGIVLSGFTRIDDGYDDRVFLRIDRVTHGVQLYKAGVVEKFLISGGQGSLVKRRLLEAEQIEELLVIMGVDKNHIIKEPNSRNTHESSLAVAKLLKEVSPDDCLLITSANHMRRSKACFDKVGFGAQPFSTDLLSHATEYTFDKFFIPSTNALWLWQVLCKEMIGYATYKIMGYI